MTQQKRFTNSIIREVDSLIEDDVLTNLKMVVSNVAIIANRNFHNVDIPFDEFETILHRIVEQRWHRDGMAIFGKPIPFIKKFLFGRRKLVRIDVGYANGFYVMFTPGELKNVLGVPFFVPESWTNDDAKKAVYKELKEGGLL